MIYIYEISKNYILITKKKRNDKLIFECSGKAEFKNSDTQRAISRKKRMKYQIKSKEYRRAYNKAYYEKMKLKKLKKQQNKHVGI
jgi:hypothetical protein